MLAALDSDAYRLFLVLHLLTAIVGFGGVVAMGIFGARAARQGGAEGAAVFNYILGSRWAEWVIYSVPVFGIIAVLLSDDAWKFSQTWVSLSFVLFIVAVGVLHGLHLPNLKRMNVLLGELASGAVIAPEGGGRPSQATELANRGQKAGIFGGILNLTLVVIVVLMVWKPGV
ncbi:MAG TPA: DUF2269 family protein [Acidimicrobiales bacterium]|nr:DUF2269 family protein [Acidimicrobiales bacterium]